MVQQFKNATEHDKKFYILNGVLIGYTGDDTDVWVPAGVREISATAFGQGHAISSIHIPDSVVSIARYAFAACAALKCITIGFGVEMIPMGCFSELHNLESVTLTDCIKSIDDYAFYRCGSLREIQFLTKQYRDPITAAEKGRAFERMLSGQSAKIEYVETTDRVPSLHRIGNYAFAGCQWFDAAALAEAATAIGMRTFEEKQEVTTTTIPTPVQPVYDVSEETVDNIAQVPALDEETTLPREPLVAGFVVKDGAIYLKTSMQRIADAPIVVLNLSTRAYNCLNRTHAYSLEETSDLMISDVLMYSPTELRNIRNMGEKTADEIIEKIQQYLVAHSEATGIPFPQTKHTLAPNYEIIAGVITNITNQHIVPDVAIDCLNLSVRATNCLHRENIRQLSELIALTQQQLRNFSNMGAKTLTEIIEFVPAYLKKNETEKTSPTEGSSGDSGFSAVLTLPQLEADVPVLAEDYAVVDGVIVSRKDYTQITDASIHVLNLRVRSSNCLEKSGLTKISCLVGLPYETFREIRNLGVRSANEIQEKLDLYLSHCHSAAGSDAPKNTIYSSADVLRIFTQHEYERLSLNAICEALPDATEEDVLQLVEHLLQEGSIQRNAEQYSIYHRSFFDSVSSLAENANVDERALTVLQMRMGGATLEEAGQHFGISRERVRQILKRISSPISLPPMPSRKRCSLTI